MNAPFEAAYFHEESPSCPCPKCLGITWAAMYVPRWGIGECGCAPSDWGTEHHHVGCLQCGYQFTMDTADAETTS